MSVVDDDVGMETTAFRIEQQPFAPNAAHASWGFILWGVSLAILLALIALPTPAAAASCTASNLRWAGTSNTIYVTGPVTCTLTAIKTLLPQAPLSLVDPGNHIWLLEANLKLEEGATLALHGSAVGGDVDELRLQSKNTSGATAIVWLRAQWGTLDIRSTRVTSWNEVVNGPDTEYATYKRAFIHVRSFLDADGVTPRESRMDIADSDVGYLGYNGAEAYGLTWKVLGVPGPFDTVNVYGNVTNSRLHHNYFGAYTYGAFGMEWRGNEIDSNVSYGLDTHDDSDNLLIENNTVHHNGNHGIICSQRCDHLTIRNNVARDNVGNGIMLHRNTNDSLVEGNQVLRNADSGIALFESHRNRIRGNTLRENRRGMRFSVGSADNLIEANEVGASSEYAFYFFKGSDAPTSGDGRPKKNVFRQNDVHDNRLGALRLADGDDNSFVENVFTANGSAFLLERSRRTILDGNTLPATIAVYTKGNSSIAGSTFIRRQKRILVKLDSYSSALFEDPQGFIFDPEETTLTTTVKPGGSSLTLTKTLIGDTSLVTTRDLRVTLTTGSVTVNPILWETSGERRRRWEVRTSSQPRNVTAIVRGLAPGTPHIVSTTSGSKNFSSPKVRTSDAAGSLSLEDTITTTSTVTYTVKPV